MSKSTRATAALDRAGVSYSVHTYAYDPDADRIGVQAADSMGVPPVTVLNVNRRPTGTHSPYTLNGLPQLAFPVFWWVPMGCRPNLAPLTNSETSAVA